MLSTTRWGDCDSSRSAPSDQGGAADFTSILHAARFIFARTSAGDTAAIRVQRAVQSSNGAGRDSARRSVRLISLPGAHEAARIRKGAT